MKYFFILIITLLTVIFNIGFFFFSFGSSFEKSGVLSILSILIPMSFVAFEILAFLGRILIPLYVLLNISLALIIALFGFVISSDQVIDNCKSNKKNIVASYIYVNYLPDYIQYLKYKKIKDSEADVSTFCVDIHNMKKNNNLSEKIKKVGENKINNLILQLSYNNYLNQKIDLGEELYQRKVNEIRVRYDSL